MPKIHIWQNPRTKQWHCTIVAHNGNILFATEGYHHRSAAIRAVQILYDYFLCGTWENIVKGFSFTQPKPSPKRRRKATAKPR